MNEVPMKLIVDLSKPEGDPDREQLVPLSSDEIAEMEAAREENARLEAEQLAAAEALQILKDSARAKLVAGEALTPEEAATIVL